MSLFFGGVGIRRKYFHVFVMHAQIMLMCVAKCCLDPYNAMNRSQKFAFKVVYLHNTHSIRNNIARILIILRFQHKRKG